MQFETIRDLALSCGFTRVGVARLEGEDVRRGLIMLYPFFDEPEAGFPSLHISSYYVASQVAHRAKGAMMEKLAAEGVMAEEGFFPAKLLAQRAGLGRYGRHGITHAPGMGTRYSIQILSVPLALPLTADEEPYEDLAACGSCQRCVKACPVGALDGQTHVDRDKCLRAHMFSGKPVPEAMRPLMGNLLLGCELCQRACPYNGTLPRQLLSELAPFRDLDAWMTADEAAFCAMAKDLGALLGDNLLRPGRLKAQLALVAGNSGKKAYAPTLAQWAQDENPLVQEHARWASARLQP